jgi:NifU-like protein involved in Fe-S cluster formation
MVTYNPLIMDHFHSPRNAGRPEGDCLLGDAENPVCLDRMKLYLQLSGGVVINACFEADGCVPAIAAGSILTERIAGLSVTQLLSVDADTIERWMGGLPASKKHAAILAAQALARALAGADNYGDAGT